MIQQWFACREARNLSGHTDEEANARNVTRLLKAFVKDTAELLLNRREYRA